jgi:hypothetical protein
MCFLFVFTFTNDWRIEMKSFTMILFVMALSLVCLTGTTRADTANLITNGDFATGDWTGWTTHMAAGVTGDSTDNAPNPPNCWLPGANTSWISQHIFDTGTTDHVIAPGETYTLSFDSANINWDESISANISGLLVYKQTSWAVLSSWTVDMPGVAIPDWQHHSFSFTAEAGAAYIGGILAMEIDGDTGTLAGTHVGVDNISLTLTPAATPEPGAFVLAGIGLLGLLAYAWRKRR